MSTKRILLSASSSLAVEAEHDATKPLDSYFFLVKEINIVNTST